MRIGLTGATGFLGSHVARRLVDDGHDVVGLRRATSSMAAMSGLALEWVVGDVSDRGAVRRLVDGCDAVVHAAAVITYWRGAGREHERVNVDGTRAVAEACRAGGVQRLVHVSSVAAVTATGAGVPADERTPFDTAGTPLSYHESKRRAEDVVAEAIEGGLDAVVVNPASLQGPYGTGFRGSGLIEGVRSRPLVPYFRGGTSIVHVDDAVSGIVGALERGRTGERYILAGENHSWRRLAEIAADLLRVRRMFIPVPSIVTAAAAAAGEARAARTGQRPRFTRDTHVASYQFLYYDSGKAARELGYHFRPYREIAREYLDSHTRPTGAA
jgi:dihydroflavonol-4-reductase